MTPTITEALAEVKRARELTPAHGLPDDECYVSLAAAQVLAEAVETQAADIIEWRKACDRASAESNSWHAAAHNLDVPCWNGKAYSDPAEFAQRIIAEAMRIVQRDEAAALSTKGVSDA